MLCFLCFFVWQASGSEQRLKQLQEELRCQRQNAESIRLQNQQRTKEMEKQHQKVRQGQMDDRHMGKLKEARENFWLLLVWVHPCSTLQLKLTAHIQRCLCVAFRTRWSFRKRGSGLKSSISRRWISSTRSCSRPGRSTMPCRLRMTR